MLFVAFVAGLAWAPFWLGGNRLPAWGINGVLFPALVLLYELNILFTGRRHPVSIRQIAWPAGFFALSVLWIFVQTSTSVPAPLVHPIWGMTADVLEQPVDGAISVNRGASFLAFIRLSTAACAFWLALQLSRNSLRSLLLLRAISLIVAGYSAYGLILAAFFSGTIPPFEAPDMGGFLRSTFVNRNSFATYSGLGLVVTTALTLRLFRDEVPETSGVRYYRVAKFIEATGRRGWFLLGTGFVILVALLGTVSRGGILATALAVFAFFALSFSRQHRRHGERIEAVVFVTVALIATFVFFGDLIVGRIGASGLEDSNRVAAYQIVARAILDTPLLGFGYGAFADVFPMYRDQSIGTLGVWDKAHNTYLEVWLGLGLLFGSMLIAALGWIVVKCFSGAVKRRQNATPAIVAAAASLLVGVHALVDFSLQIEAVALTYMALLGAGAAQSESSRKLISD